MPNAFIFHGTGGYPGENWFPWLKRELEKLGYTVVVPQFPTPENQTPASWLEAFGQYGQFLSSDTLLIGHSLGGTFLLRVLEKYDVKIKAAFLVATPIGVMPIKNIATDWPFLRRPFGYGKIKCRAGKFFVFHSDDDPYVPLGNGEELSRHLGVPLTFVPHAGHFNSKSGYLAFPLLLEKIKEIKKAK
ncbi:Serine hydrolase [uncultured archaeon]|nr:Serine hydrolase [uncultured archaeon]